MASKWIVVDGKFILSPGVEYHKQLVPRNYTKVSGGGSFFIDDENNRVILYGTSMDFGSPTNDDVIYALSNSYLSPYIETMTFYLMLGEYYLSSAKGIIDSGNCKVYWKSE